MTKAKRKERKKINGARAIKIGGLVVFAGFAAILAFVSVFVWKSLDDLGAKPTGSSGANVQGVNESLLDEVERRISERLNAPYPDEARLRNPFMPIGQQQPALTQPAELPAAEAPDMSEPTPGTAAGIPAKPEPEAPIPGSPPITQ